jgi:hypothetical protein
MKMKKVLIGFGVVLLLIVGGVVFLYSNLGDVIKEAIQRFGSEATQATVVLDNVDLDVTNGKTALQGFIVGNPSGFKTDSAFELGNIAVQVDTSSLDADTIVINSVAINGPKITYELGDGGSNVDAIKRNVDTYAKQFSSGDSAASSSQDSGPQKKIIIERLTITDGRINVSAPFLDGKSLGSDLPTITLTDIGKDSGGANPADVIKRVIDEMTKGVGGAISGLNLDDLRKQATAKAQEAIDKATSGASNAVKSATEGAGTAGEAASGAADDASKAIKGLLGN